jgi:gliding motility-associated-like protein
MRNIILILFASWLFPQWSAAQAVVLKTDTVEVNCGSTTVFTVPVRVQNFTNIGSFQYTLTWNPANLKYKYITAFNSALLTGTVNVGFDTAAVQINAGRLTFNWTKLGGGTLPNDAIVFRVAFERVGGGFSPVAFGNTPVPVEVTDNKGNELPNRIINGGVRSKDAGLPTITCPANVTRVSSGPVAINGIAPTAADDCGTPAIGWASTGATAASAPADADASGQIFDIGTSTVTYTARDVAGNTVSCSFSVKIDLGGGTDLTVIAGADTAACGDQLSIPITAQNFTGLGSLQFSLRWNGQLLKFDSVGAFNKTLLLSASSFNTAQATNGRLSFNWTTSTPLTGTTVANDAVLFRVFLKVTGGQSANSVMEFDDQPAVREAFKARPLTEIKLVTINGQIVLKDDQAPTLTCPQSRSENAPNGGITAVFNNLQATATDNCSDTRVTYVRTGATTGSGQGSADGTYNAGTSVVTYTATDAAGNSSTCSFRLIVNAASALTVALDTTGLPCNTTNTNVSFQVRVRNFANVYGLQFSIAWDTMALQFQSVTNEATGLGITSSTFLGFATAPQGILRFLGGNPVTGWPALPNGDTLFTVNFRVRNANADSPVRFIGPFDAVNGQFQSVSLLTLSGLLRKSDTKGPTLSACPENILVSTAANACTATTEVPLPTAMDDCSGVRSITSTAPANKTYNPGITTVVFTATDNAGNTSTCSALVTVVENVPPVFSNCPAGQSINLPATKCDTTFTWIPPTATDNCGALKSLTATRQPGSRFPAGRTLVVYTATDQAGNSASCSFTLTATDPLAPVFRSCPQDIVVNTPGACDTTVNWQLPVADDNCGTPVIDASHTPTTRFAPGTTTVVILARDGSGNLDTCSFKVTLNGGQGRGFAEVPPNQSFVLTEGCTRAVTWTEPIPTGYCKPPRITRNFRPDTLFGPGVSTVIYTATDENGSTASASFTITITEGIAPTITCPSAALVNLGGSVVSDPGRVIEKIDTAGCTGVRLRLVSPTATDNCGTPEVTQTTGPKSGEVFMVGTQTITYTARDKSGNSTACSFLVEVTGLESLAPKVTPNPGCEGSRVELEARSIPGAVYTWTGPLGTFPNSNKVPIASLNSRNAGEYRVFAEINGCRTATSPVTVVLATKPQANDDLNFTITTGGIDTFNVLANDSIRLLSDLNFKQLTEQPGLTLLPNNRFAYTAGEDTKDISFIYEICSKACPTLCDMATVTIRVFDGQCKFIPNVFTPNGDDQNDTFKIPCLDTERYTDNSLIVFNQWGSVVFEAAPYSNAPDKAWTGNLKNEIGKELPDGPYYYIFKPGSGLPAVKGFIQIFR